MSVLLGLCAMAQAVLGRCEHKEKRTLVVPESQVFWAEKKNSNQEPINVALLRLLTVRNHGRLGLIVDQSSGLFSGIRILIILAIAAMAGNVSKLVEWSPEVIALVLKINPEHCPPGLFTPNSAEDWEGKSFKVPWPRTLSGKKLKITEIEIGAMVWVWTHVKNKNAPERPLGLMATAQVSAVEASNAGLVQLSLNEVELLPINLLRARIEPLANESAVVKNLLSSTTRRTAALASDEAEEFSNLIIRFISDIRVRTGNSPWQGPMVRLTKNEGSGSLWTDLELKVCMVAYLEMLGKEQAGVAYSKSAYRSELLAGPLGGRTDSAVEYRMQNISAFFLSAGLAQISGYKPAQNVGAKVIGRLQGIFDSLQIAATTDFEPTDDLDVLASRAASLRKAKSRLNPIGNKNPERGTRESKYFLRDPAVVSDVLIIANGTCELCGGKAPFITAKGEPFLEVHHVKFLGDGGPDTTCNAAAVCPNCHRALHLGQDMLSLRKQLIKQIDRLKNY